MLPAGFSMALSDNLTVLYSQTCLKELSWDMHTLFIDYKEIAAAYGLDELSGAFVARELVQ